MTRNLGGLPIVAGVDGSESALDAALWAADEAAREQVPLRLVASDGIAPAYSGGIAPPQSFFDAMDRDGRRLLDEARTAVAEAHPGLDPTVEMRTAGPAASMIESSRAAWLVVLGARGTGGFHGMLTGSTAVSVVALGHCPVAVIRNYSHDDAAARGPVVVGVDGSPKRGRPRRGPRRGIVARRGPHSRALLDRTAGRDHLRELS
ncbi:MAG: universal stress protein [Pseudonocardia sp.]|nr:universal stress protein [Pseudonocardia sp.]MDT7701430.1 hypothetical protein [Pseudonocardiales bacterium]